MLVVVDDTDHALALPIDETDDRVLGVIEGEVLTPAFIERVLDTVFVPDAINREALEADAIDLERQIANLTAAVAHGGHNPSLVEELKRTNARLADVRRRLEPREHHDREQLRLALEQRVDEWKQVLRSSPAQGRPYRVYFEGAFAVTASPLRVIVAD